MATIQELKSRISSIESTAKITRAMQLVSASRMQHAQQRALAAQPYAESILELVSKLAGQSETENPYLKEVRDPKKIAIMVIGTNRGFVGSLISALTVKVFELSQSLHREHPAAAIEGISIHKTGLRILSHAHVPGSYHFAQDFENATTSDLSAIFKLVTENYLSGKLDMVYLVYPHFVNTLLQRPEAIQILPVRLGEVKLEEERNRDPFIYEPGIDAVIDRLLEEYVQSQIYTGVLEGLASEHSARMLAMKNATDNAEELEEELNLSYNRQRQAGITQELIEVINGAG